MAAAFKETTYVVFSCTVPSGGLRLTEIIPQYNHQSGVNQYAAARLFDRNGDGRIDINDFVKSSMLTI